MIGEMCQNIGCGNVTPSMSSHLTHVLLQDAGTSQDRQMEDSNIECGGIQHAMRKLAKLLKHYV